MPTQEEIISIHALLAESDTSEEKNSGKQQISIHALLAESDYDTSSLMRCQVKFLSTLSLRRATLRVLDGSKSSLISIHALLAESDGVHYDNYNLHCVISIHALLAESDSKSAQNSGALLRI